ncbi:MAG: NYN domain-containing protein [Christensenellales bacterium]|jgi:predicted RNA-binding protein with PIN domain
MRKPPKKLLIVDGYNVMNAWGRGAQTGALADARDAFTAKLHDYAGFTGQEVVVVFDAWMQARAVRTEERAGLLTIVYTQKNETADHYIERLCDRLAREVEFGRLEIRVATSDNVEQTVILGRGATRLSARELIGEMARVRTEGGQIARAQTPRKATILDRLPDEIRERLDEMRKGR